MKKTIILILLLTVFGATPGYCVCNGPNCDGNPDDSIALFVTLNDEVWQAKDSLSFVLFFETIMPDEVSRITELNYVMRIPAGATLRPISGSGDVYIDLSSDIPYVIHTATTACFDGYDELLNIKLTIDGDGVYFDSIGRSWPHIPIGKFCLDCSKVSDGRYSVLVLGDGFKGWASSSIGTENGLLIRQYDSIGAIFTIKGDSASGWAYYTDFGDVNFDGYINVYDVSLIYKCILSGEYNVACDINCNGFVNVEDVSKLYKIILDQ